MAFRQGAFLCSCLNGLLRGALLQIAALATTPNRRKEFYAEFAAPYLAWL